MNKNRSVSFYYWQGKNLLLDLYVQARANKDAFGGQHGDRMKITITAPAIGGKANKHLVKFLAQYFRVPQSRVEIVRGNTSRYKSILISEPQKHQEEFAKWP